MQSRKHSALEALVNVAVGYLTAFPINCLAAYVCGYSMPVGENLTLITLFSLWSFVRQYIIRRVFIHIPWRKWHVQLYVAYLKFSVRKESEDLCCCGNMESSCGYSCLPAHFVSAKWYYINKAVEKRFGKGTTWR